MHNFPSDLSCVATLPKNTLATKSERCFAIGEFVWKDHGWYEHL